MRIPSPLRFVPLALFALTPPAEEIAFGVEEGTVVTKTIVDTSSFDLDDVTLTVNGQDLTALFDVDFSVNTDQTVRVTDSYDAIDDGRPGTLTRTFDELAMTLSMSATADGQGEDQDMEGESDLEGTTVVFTWDPDAEEYDIEFADDDGDDDLLEGLDADLDLLALLPDEEISEGDSWEVELQDLGPLHSPGGDLKIIPDEVGDDEMAFGEAFKEGLSQELADAFEGTCICTFEGVIEGEEGRLAEISIEVEASATYDLSEAMLSMLDALSQQTGEEMPEVSVDAADLSFDIVGTGTILWDLEAGRLRSYEALGDLEVAVDVSMFIEIPGQPASMEGAAELSGSFSKNFESEE